MPPVLINNYNLLAQAGIAVKNRRSSAENDELQGRRRVHDGV